MLHARGLFRIDGQFLIAVFVNGTSHGINPAKAKRLIHGLGPVHRRFAGTNFIKADEQFSFLVMVFYQPFSEFGLCWKKVGVMFFSLSS